MSDDSNGSGSREMTCREKVLAFLMAVGFFVRTFHNIIMALVVRFFFLCTGSFLAMLAIMTWRKATQLDDKKEKFNSAIMLPLMIPHVLIVLETFYVIVRKCGQDYRWFCVSVFLYLLSAVPSLVILQNYEVQTAVVVQVNNSTAVAKLTPYERGMTHEEIVASMELQMERLKTASKVKEPAPYPANDFNQSENWDQDLYSVGFDGSAPGSNIKMYEDKFKDGLHGLVDWTEESSESSPFAEYFNSSGVNSYIQLMLVVLLFGRWLLPRGTISREQLSALLISYLSMCADMLDFISVLSEDEIYRNDLCRHLIQIIWIISLFQFTIVKSNVVNGRQRRDWVEQMNEKGFLIDVRTSGEEEVFMRKMMMNKFTETDLWEVLSTMMLQDLPFLIVRLMLVFRFGVNQNDSIYFFMVKNSVLVMMDVYRLMVILLSPSDDEDDDSLQNLVPILSHEVQVITVHGSEKRKKKSNEEKHSKTDEVDVENLPSGSNA